VPSQDRPKVGIVTRTKDRTVLLKRALDSVIAQTYQDWSLVIVNDGGPPEAVDRLVSRYLSDAGGRIRVIHNARSLGMEGASKVGIDAIDSDLLAVHDDDDSWAPEFVATAVAELQRRRDQFPSIQGVAAYANLVTERIVGNIVHTDAIEAFNDWAPPGFVSLDRMLASNFIPPISFVFTQTAFRELGGVYEAIPYLGDWDFLIRFLCKYDIYMIPQYLAFYHWRTAADATSYGNSVISEVDRHHWYRQYLLNQWLRRDFASGTFGVGAYANLRNRVAAEMKTLLNKLESDGALV
jgi:glycosyltransferase involved in cell wall biosynthesis